MNGILSNPTVCPLALQLLRWGIEEEGNSCFVSDFHMLKKIVFGSLHKISVLQTWAVF